MNESDADYLSQGLTAAGFSAVADLDQADLAILVTCSVRQHAEQKPGSGRVPVAPSP